MSTEEDFLAARQEYLRLSRRRLQLLPELGRDDENHPHDYAEYHLLGRKERAALQALLALAPTGPRDWWPGGWRLMARRLPVDHYRREKRGGIGDRGLWRTREDAERYLQAEAEPELRADWERGDVRVEWCAVLEEDREIQAHGADFTPTVLDSDFWFRQDAETTAT